MPLLPSRPWKIYEDVWVTRFQEQLRDADKSFVLVGWKDGDIRDRIDRIINAQRIAQFLEGTATTQKALVHDDLTVK